MMFEFTLKPPGDVAYSFQKTGGNLGEGLGAEIKAVCSAPAKFAGREATVLLTSSLEFEDAEFLKAKHPTRSVGQVFADKNNVEALATVPAGRLLPLMAAIAAGQIAYISFYVGPFKARRADASGYHFEGQAQREASLTHP